MGLSGAERPGATSHRPESGALGARGGRLRDVRPRDGRLPGFRGTRPPGAFDARPRGLRPRRVLLGAAPETFAPPACAPVPATGPASAPVPTTGPASAPVPTTGPASAPASVPGPFSGPRSSAYPAAATRETTVQPSHRASGPGPSTTQPAVTGATNPPIDHDIPITPWYRPRAWTGASRAVAAAFTGM